MMKYAKDLHRKGELNKIEQMEKLGKKLIRGKDMGLAFVTEGFLGYDGFGVIANKAQFIENEGAVLFDNDLNKPVFVSNDKLEMLGF